MKSIHYAVVRNGNQKNAQIDTKKLKGYHVNPKNSKKYIDVEVNSMTLINPTFIEKILKKKIKKKLDFYLQYIIQLIESDDSDMDSTNLAIALNDLAHYKSIIEYKYRKFLDEKYINLLLKKIELLEHEIRRKVEVKNYEYYNQYYNNYEEEKGKAR